MNSWEQREKTFEDKFAHDEELKFKINAKRLKLTGLWAAGKMMLDDVQATEYAQTVVDYGINHADLIGVAAKIVEDIDKAGNQVTEAEVMAVLQEKLEEAEIKLMAAS
jgi:hypothetical protein